MVLPYQIFCRNFVNMKTIQHLLDEISHSKYSRLTDSLLLSVDKTFVYTRAQVQEWHKIFMAEGALYLRTNYGISKSTYSKQFKKFGLDTKCGFCRGRAATIVFNQSESFIKDLFVLTEKDICEKYKIGKGTVYRYRKDFKDGLAK